jgi:hypothetical protein
MIGLINDLDSAILDLECDLTGTKSIYAVDFTEISAFVMPGANGERNSLLADLTETEDIAFDLATLGSVFFGSPWKPNNEVVLLPPHKLELRNANDFFQQASLDQFRQIVQSAYDELRVLVGKDDTVQLLSRLRNAATDQERDAARKQFVQYLNENAANLLLAANPEAIPSAAYRLRHLLNNSTVIDVSNVPGIGRPILPRELDYDLVEEMSGRICNYRTLAAKRRQRRLQIDELLDPNELSPDHKIENTSRRDAVAIGYLARANELLQSKEAAGDPSKKMLLLTRSSAIYAAVRFSRHASLREFVRRSGSFGVSLLHPSVSAEDRLTSLKQRRQSLQLAVDGLKLPSTPHNLQNNDHEVHHDRVNTIQALQKLWRGAVNLGVAAHPMPVSTNINTVTSRIIDVLENDQELSTYIRRAAETLSANISLNNALLGVLTVDLNESEKIVTDCAHKQNGRSPRFIWSPETASTVGLFFYCREAQRAGQKKADGQTALRRILDAGLKGYPGNSPEASYELPDFNHTNEYLVESCLASSLLEAIASKWGRARIYADLAVNWPSDIADTARYEAFFMRAVSRSREHDMTEEIFKSGLDDLNLARNELNKYTRYKDDARFAFETGVYYFNMWEQHISHSEVTSRGAQSIQPADAASQQFNEALQHFERARNILLEPGQTFVSHIEGYRDRLNLDIANADCYARLVSGRIDDSAFRSYADLMNQMRQCGLSFSTVPVGILDTICYATYYLRDRFDDDKATIQKPLDELISRLPSDNHPEKQKLIMRTHIETIQRYLNS